MLHHKSDLRRLQTATAVSARFVIATFDDAAVSLLIKILREVAIGQIGMKKKTLEHLVQKKKHTLIKKLAKKDFFLELQRFVTSLGYH